MSVDDTTVRRIARLARIKVSDQDVDRFGGEINDILKWIEMLDEVDVKGVEPMTSVVDVAMKMRQDLVDDGACPSDILANAPASEDNFFMVPKVVE